LELILQATGKIEQLLEIMAALRDPETGCPWDVEQSFETIAPYTLEEVYEVLDAIERQDKDDLREELGDLLLQVVFHARIAQEEGSFTFDDVVQAITHKMIRRHPHVFGDEEARSAGMAKGAWGRIKMEEKAEREARRLAAGLTTSENNGYLDDIPRAFPALLRALKLQLKAAKVGFDWNEPEPILAKIEEEIAEFKEAKTGDNQKHIEEEYGDLLFAMVNLGRHMNIDPEIALMRANDKFLNRFHYIEKELASNHISLEQSNLDDMELLWQQAKKTGL
jgi:ATP diphosphatase